jgi:hypothetical protein
MATDFQPQLSILPVEQRRLWPELSSVPREFVLCGGTAIALQLAHRSSYDFDFIAQSEFDPDLLASRMAFLGHAKTLQKAPNTLTCLVDRGAPIQVSFFGAPAIKLIRSPRIAADTQLQIASLLDLAGMKAVVVQKRAEAKDYIDIDAIVERGDVDLPSALAAAAAKYGPSFNPQLTLKALCYFGDGNLNTLSREIQDRLSAAVRAVDLDRLPKISASDTK